MKNSNKWDQRNVMDSKSFKQFFRDYYSASRVYMDMQREARTPVRRFQPLTKSSEDLASDLKDITDQVWDEWAMIFNIPSLVRSRAVDRESDPTIKWKYAPSVMTGWKLSLSHSKELAGKEERVMKERQEEMAAQDSGAR